MSEQQAGTTSVDTSTAPSRGRGSTIAAVVCFVLAAVLTVPALTAYWGQRTINDTARYVATVGPLVNDPQVQAVISTKVTDAIQQQVDVQSVIDQAFSGVITDRPRLQLLVGPISAAINGFIAKEVATVVASPQFADIWVAANTQAQEDLTALLRGESAQSMSIQNDQLVLNLDGVITAVKTRLVARGLTVVEKIPVPSTDKQIVLLTAPALAQAKTIYAFTNPVATWLIWVVALLYLGAFLLARRRPRMAVAIGIALAVNALLMAWGLAVAQQLFVNELSGTALGPASGVFWTTLIAFLDRGWHVMLWLGVAIAAGGWFAGRNASGTAVRGFVGGALESGGAALSDTFVGGAGRAVAGAARWLRWAAVALGFVVLVWGADLTTERLLWTVVLVVALLAVIQVLVGAGAGHASGTDADPGAGPDATPEPEPATATV